MNRFLSCCLVIACLALAASTAMAKPNDPSVQLEYLPQQSVGVATVDLASALLERPVEIRLADSRPGEPDAIGTRTNDDDELFQLVATNEVLPFVREILVRNAREWGVAVQEQAELILDARLVAFNVAELNKAVGATYRAEVRIAFDLTDQNGGVLHSGVSFGDSTRYGRKFSNVNCNEVLSDAMIESFASLFSDPGLHAAWSGETVARAAPGPQATGNPVAPADLLGQLVSLMDGQFEAQTLADYVKNKTLTAGLNAQDLTDWKSAGVPEEVIRVALNLPISR